MNRCKCGALAEYRVIVVTPADLPNRPANQKGTSWVLMVCAACLPFMVRLDTFEKEKAA